ncbi:MAG: hypothetical protein NVSMB3_07990 [Acidobacteriaceae bacterium]
MRNLSKLAVSAVLAMTTAMPMVAQRDRNNGYVNGQYSEGLHRGYNDRNGGYNDQYDRQRYSRNDNRYNGRDYSGQDEYNRTHGGIGPGKGAAIGGAGGAVLGGLFGGGLKGAIIGGAAGAGVGAVAGKVHQNHQQNDWRDYRYGR